jgi:SAM-dependent methyltransferase
MSNQQDKIDDNQKEHSLPPQTKAQSPKDYYSHYPATDPAYTVIRISGALIRKKASKYFSGKLIDIGCGKGLKRGLVGEFVDEYIGMDHESCPHGTGAIDLVGESQNIPIDDGTFDCILCTAVIEHLRYPQEALNEAYRILKPGGYALYTAPLIWHLHEEPHDYFRYTRYGLEHLFKSAGFTIVELIPLSGFWVTFGTESSYYLCRFKKGILKPVINLLVALINWISPKLDRGPLLDERFTWMYMVVARKQ